MACIIAALLGYDNLIDVLSKQQTTLEQILAATKFDPGEEVAEQEAEWAFRSHP